jgi:hypothetical protein
MSQPASDALYQRLSKANPAFGVALATTVIGYGGGVGRAPAVAAANDGGGGRRVSSGGCTAVSAPISADAAGDDGDGVSMGD